MFEITSVEAKNYSYHLIVSYLNRYTDYRNYELLQRSCPGLLGNLVHTVTIKVFASSI